jgi:hypothetical protein
MNDNAKSSEDFWEVVKQLNRDASLCMGMLEALPEDDEKERVFWRRMYARTVFEVMDGAVYGMIYHAFVTRNRPNAEFSPEELIRLEGAYDFDDDAEASATFSIEQMLDDIRFAFMVFARVHSSHYRLPTHEPEWYHIKEIARIRHKLRYPREAKNLEVTEGNINHLLPGLHWFIERSVDLFKACADALEELELPGSAEDEIIM